MHRPPRPRGARREVRVHGWPLQIHMRHRPPLGLGLLRPEENPKHRVAWVVPDALLRLEVEIEDLAAFRLAWLPRLRQWLLQALSCYPKELLILCQVHAKPLGILLDLLFIWLVVLGNALGQHSHIPVRLCRALALDVILLLVLALHFILPLQEGLELLRTSDHAPYGAWQLGAPTEIEHDRAKAGDLGEALSELIHTAQSATVTQIQGEHRQALEMTQGSPELADASELIAMAQVQREDIQ
mmetsp:Transcript_35267/g.76823  ORF Transcript_35267/g.76823 Transcript_35267/m.76823 type:complete len:242 (-) Transcript_35267:1136-1861(-)